MTVSVDPSFWKMLHRGGYLDPRVSAIFPYRSNQLHFVPLVEKTDRDAGHVWVFGAAHEHLGSAVWAEELVECAAQICCARELLGISFNFDLMVRVVSCFSEW